MRLLKKQFVKTAREYSKSDSCHAFVDVIWKSDCIKRKQLKEITKNLTAIIDLLDLIDDVLVAEFIGYLATKEDDAFETIFNFCAKALWVRSQTIIEKSKVVEITNKAHQFKDLINTATTDFEINFLIELWIYLNEDDIKVMVKLWKHFREIFEFFSQQHLKKFVNFSNLIDVCTDKCIEKLNPANALLSYLRNEYKRIVNAAKLEANFCYQEIDDTDFMFA